MRSGRGISRAGAGSEPPSMDFLQLGYLLLSIRFVSLFKDEYKLPKGSVIELSRESNHVLKISNGHQQQQEEGQALTRFVPLHLQSVIAVVFLGVLEKARLGRWGHAMAQARGQQEESGRHDGGHVDVIVALTHFAPPTLHINITAHIYMELHEKVSRLGSCILLFTKGQLCCDLCLSIQRKQLIDRNSEEATDGCCSSYFFSGAQVVHLKISTLNPPYHGSIFFINVNGVGLMP